MTPEGHVKERVKEILKRLGIFYFMPVGSIYGRHGVADIIAVIHGKIIAIETKAKGNTPTKMQERFLRDVTMAGGVSMVVDEIAMLSLERVLRAMQLEGEG